MAVQRDRITVFPPDGETVTVDILDTGVSLGTVHAERATTRTLTLPLTITAATSFYVPAGTGPYDVSVKLDGEEIAGPSGSPVTVSTFPAEVRARVNAAELPSLSGGSSAVDLPRSEYRASSQAMPSANGSFSWSLGPSTGFEALDLTDPENPTVVQGGIYALTLAIQSDARYVGKFARVMLSADDTGYGWVAGDVAPLDIGGSAQGLGCSITVYLPAGAVVTTYFSQDVAADTAFSAWLAVQAIQLDPT
jgi:hypothetical protein